MSEVQQQSQMSLESAKKSIQSLGIQIANLSVQKTFTEVERDEAHDALREVTQERDDAVKRIAELEAKQGQAKPAKK